jgi:SAM-dependent methyltransferase
MRVSGRVLVPGCGPGHDVRELAKNAEVQEAVGLDIAPSAVERATVFGNGGRYVCGDLFHLPSDWAGSFGWVWEHTCFCAIEPELRTAYVDAVAGCLRPGGKFFGVFYLDPGHGRGESGPPFGVSPAELDRLFKCRFRLLEEWDPSQAYPGREGRERMRWMEKL